MADWNKFMSGVEDATDPFKKTLTTTLGSLLSPKKIVDAAAEAPATAAKTYFTNTLTNLVSGDKQSEQPGPRVALDNFSDSSARVQNQLLAQNITTADPFLMGQTYAIPDGIIGNMNFEGQGAPHVYGFNGIQPIAFPGADFGFATT